MRSPIRCDGPRFHLSAWCRAHGGGDIVFPRVRGRGWDANEDSVVVGQVGIGEPAGQARTGMVRGEAVGGLPERLC